jgi:hypothetical protein
LNLGASLTYAFADADWIGKLVIVMTLAFFGAILTPVLIGFLPICILLGYMLGIVDNVRDNRMVVLPVWKDYETLLSRGVNVLLAVFVYNLPLSLMSCCVLFVPGWFGDVLGSLVSLTALCCVLPLALITIWITWPMLAVGVARYGRSNRSNDLFEFGSLWTASRAAGPVTLQWLLCVIILNLLFVLSPLLPPCLGVVVALALYIPVQGHLLGQYARALDAQEKSAAASRRKPM